MVVHHSPVPQWVDTARREQQRGVKAVAALGLRPGGSEGEGVKKRVNGSATTEQGLRCLTSADQHVGAVMVVS